MIVRLPLGRLNNHMCDRLLLVMIVVLHTTRPLSFRIGQAPNQNCCPDAVRKLTRLFLGGGEDHSGSLGT